MAQEKGYEQFTRRSNVNLLGKKPSQSARDYLKAERDRSDREDKKKKKEAELRKLREINAKPIVEKKTGSRKGSVTGKIETDTKKGVDKTNKKALSGFDYGAPKQAQPDAGGRDQPNRLKKVQYRDWIQAGLDPYAQFSRDMMVALLPKGFTDWVDRTAWRTEHGNVGRSGASETNIPIAGSSTEVDVAKSLGRQMSPNLPEGQLAPDPTFRPKSRLLDTRQDDVVQQPISDRLRAIANRVMSDRGIIDPGNPQAGVNPVLAGAPLSQEYGSDSVDFRQHSGGQPSQPTVPGGTPQQPSALQGFDFGAPIASSTPIQGSNNKLSQSPQPATNLGGTPGSFVLPGSPDRPSQPGIGEAPVQAIPQTPVNYPRVDRTNPGEGGVTQAPVNPTLPAQPTAPVAPTQPQLQGSPGGSISPSTYGYGGRSAAGVDTSGIAYSEPVRTSNNRLSRAPAAPSVGSTYQLPGQSGRPATPEETAAIQERFNWQRDNQARSEYERQKRIHDRGFDPTATTGLSSARTTRTSGGRGSPYIPPTRTPDASPRLGDFVPGGTRQEARRSPGPVSKVSGRPPLSPEDLQGLRDAYKGGTQLNQEQSADLLRSIGENKERFFQGGGGGATGAVGAAGASQPDTYELTPEEELDFDIATKDMSEEEKDNLMNQLTRRGRLEDSGMRQWMSEIESLLEQQSRPGAWNPRQFMAWEPMWWDPYLGVEA